MKRQYITAALLSILIFTWAGCGKEKEPVEKSPSPIEFKAREAIQYIESIKQVDSSLRKQTEEIDLQLQELRRQQNEMENLIRERQLGLEKSIAGIRLQLVELSTRTADLDNALRSMRGLEQIHQVAGKQQPPAEEGWPLLVKILIVIAIVVVLIVLLKKMTQSEDFEDDDLLDEEFLEENDLGTVRYPADAEMSAKADQAASGSDDQESATDQDEKQSS